MGVAASAASPPLEAAAPADPPAEVIKPAATADAPSEAAAAADPAAKEDIQNGAAADPPSEAAAPADSPAKEEIQSAAPTPSDAPGGDAKAAAETVVLDGAAAAEAGEEEQGECGFCLYMKGGGCKEEFVEWEKCIEAAEAEGGNVDIVDRCAKATTTLRTCMGKFPDYYEVILSAERAMSDDLEAAAKAEAESGQASPASPPALTAEGEQGDNKHKPEEVVIVVEKEDPAA